MDKVRIDPLKRVEGLGRLFVNTEGGKVKDVRLEIFEPPRFFEKLLIGKEPDAVLDTVARICGLCPVAYQMSATEAFERIFGVEVSDSVRILRRVLYCGEWIASHSAHIFFLHLPDFFGKENFLQLAKERTDLLNMGLSLRKVGNWIIEVIGGRHIHPVNLRVGGFYRLPSEGQIESTLQEIERAIPLAQELLDLTFSLEYPELEGGWEMISLGEADTYPITEGKIVSSRGWSVDKNRFEEKVEEYQEPRSTALYARLRGGETYMVGPLARLNNNYNLLPPQIRDKVKVPVNNPYKSIIARAVEILYSLEEAKRLLERVSLEGEPYTPWEPREGEGIGVTEAPRGILYHRYRVDRKGKVVEANIVPPTSQNQRVMEEAVLNRLRENNVDMVVEAEKVVRSFDPCISCASHFLVVVKLP